MNHINPTWRSDTKERVSEEMKRSFHTDYERINKQAHLLREGQSIEEGTVSIEEFRKAGIDVINQAYLSEFNNLADIIDDEQV